MKKWVIQLYGFLLTIIVFNSLRELYSTNSALRSYYTILIAFDRHYSLLLALNVISTLLGLLSPLVIFLYTSDIKGSYIFWRVFFWTRLFFDAIGHSYDTQFVKAAFHQSIFYGFVCILIFILPFIPSYIIHYLYAFKKLKPQQANLSARH